MTVRRADENVFGEDAFTGKQTMQLRIETEQEIDGRWIAELPDLPGALAYGNTRENAIAKVQALASRHTGLKPEDL
jgi:predicted RNase H-like HicB family nuclease